jgi:hypothetical protein
MGLNVFDLFDHYDLKSCQTSSEAIRGESPSNSVQQGNFVADDPCPFHTSLQIDQVDITSNPFFHSLTHSYHNPSHKSYTYTYTFTHNSSSVCPSHLLSLLRSLVSSLVALFPPPLSCRLVSTSRYLALIEMISHRRIRLYKRRVHTPCYANTTTRRRNQRGLNIDQPDRLAKEKKPVRTKGFFSILVSSRTLYIPCLVLSFSTRSSLPSLFASLSQQ